MMTLWLAPPAGKVALCRKTNYEQLFKRPFKLGEPWSNRPNTRVTPLSRPLSIRHHQKAVARRSHTGWNLGDWV